MDEVLSHGGRVLGSHPELEIKPIMPSPAPLTFQINGILLVNALNLQRQIQ